MPTTNRRMTFMLTKEMEERLRKVKDKPKFKGKSEGEVIRQLIMMACVADESLSTKEKPAS